MCVGLFAQFGGGRVRWFRLSKYASVVQRTGLIVIGKQVL